MVVRFQPRGIFGNKNRRYDFVWAIGSDLLSSLSKWGEAAALSQLVEFCVFQRGGEAIDGSQTASPLVMPQIPSTELLEIFVRAW